MDEYKKFFKKHKTKRFSKGEIILHQDEVPGSAYVVKSGIVKTYNLTTNGEEKPIIFSVKDEVFPIGWLFSKIRRSQYFYEAFTDCELYIVPQDKYIEFLKSNPVSLYEIFDHFIGTYISYQTRINALEQSKAADKILGTFDFFAKRFGRTIQDDQVKIDIPLTHQDLANFMGLTRETTGLELKKLEKKGVITHRKHTFTIMTKKLARLQGEDYIPPPPRKLPRIKISWPTRLR